MRNHRYRKTLYRHLTKNLTQREKRDFQVIDTEMLQR